SGCKSRRRGSISSSPSHPTARPCSAVEALSTQRSPAGTSPPESSCLRSPTSRSPGPGPWPSAPTANRWRWPRESTWRSGTRPPARNALTSRATCGAISPAWFFSADGRNLAGARDGEVFVWEAATGKVRLRLRPQGHVVYGVAFSPDGGTLAAALFNGTAHVWDAATGKELRVLKGHVEEVRAVAFSPDGKTLATGGEDQTVRLWDVTTGRQRLAPGGLDGLVRRIAFAPDGRTVATAGEEKVIRLLDAATGAERRQLVGHDGRVIAVAFSPDSRCLASGGEDSPIRLWDPSTGRELLRGNHAGVSRDLAFGPDGTLASGGHVTAIRLWKVPARVPVAPGKGPASWHESKWLERLDTRFVERMVFSPSGRALILVMTGQPLSIWDMEEAAPRPFREDAVRLGDLSHFALAPDGHTAVSVHPDARGGGLFGGGALGRVWRWDLRTKKDGAALVQKEGQGGSILHGAVGPDGRRVAHVRTDGS